MADILIHTVEHELLVNRSRFVATACPVDDADTAMAAVQALRLGDAHHNAWAYRIGNDYRFNDDGEVGGTAGRPILAAIEGQGLDRVVLRVARWFGGVKLGTGGLVRAYGGCAAECLRAAPRRALVEQAAVHCVIAFALEPALRSALTALDGRIVTQQYQADGLHLQLSLPDSHADALRTLLTDLSRGKVVFLPSP